MSKRNLAVVALLATALVGPASAQVAAGVGAEPSGNGIIGLDAPTQACARYSARLGINNHNPIAGIINTTAADCGLAPEMAKAVVEDELLARGENARGGPK